MIRYLLIVIFFSLGTSGFCATPVDSLKIKLNHIEKVYQKRTDSLQKELLFYKVKEDYYSNALSDQASHFEMLISIFFTVIGFIITILGLISFRFIDKKIESAQNKWTRSIEEQDIKNKEFLAETNNIKADLHYQLGVSINRHTYHALNQMETYQKINGYLAALNNFIRAYIYESDTDTKEMLEQSILRNLRNNTILIKQLLEEIEEKESEEKKNFILRSKESVHSGKKSFIKYYPNINFSEFQSQGVELIALLNKIDNLLD